MRETDPAPVSPPDRRSGSRSAGRSRLLEEIARLSEEQTHERKLLLCQTPAQGRELLRAVALSGTPWLGWEVTTPRTLAHDLLLPELARAGLSRADEFDLLALSDAAIDAVEARGESGPFSGTTASSGYRDAIRRSLQSLREGGVTPDQLRRARPGDTKLRALGSMLAELERRLAEQRLLDAPGLMTRAAAALTAGEVHLPEGLLFLMEGLPLRGAVGRFLRAVQRVGAGRVRVVAGDGVVGVEAPRGLLGGASEAATGPLSALHAPLRTPERPQLDLFVAATPTDELREVLRRVLAGGIHWDQVEILTPDPITYGAALHALARRLDIPVTYSRGLDSRRTRAGRAVEAFLRWIGEDFPADTLRSMLESGDLAPPPPAEEVGGSALARRLRRLSVGWGRERYLPAVDRALAALADAPTVAEDIAPELLEARREREAQELTALRTLLARLLGAVPHPDAGATSAAAIARAVQAFLDLLPPHSDVAERTMRRVIADRLARIRDALTREVRWEAAIATVRANLVTRIAPAGERGLAPWTSTAGHLYLADLVTGGLSHRPYVFVVGMDAGRTGGGGGGDPLLSDADRAAIAAAGAEGISPIALSAERLAEARYTLAATLARLRGGVTMSYSAWESAEGRAISPAPELLQALRLREGNETLTYQDLRREMGSLIGAVPVDGRLVDGDDVWLDALAEGRVLRSGTEVVRSVFPGLDAGLRARAARRSDRVTEYDGLIAPHPELDPRSERAVFSATRLETLGSCPRHYFYEYVLRVKPLQDPELDPDVWLDALARGNLLHAVYEEALSEARRRGVDYDEPAFAAIADECFDRAAERALRRQPPPNQAAYEQEMLDLRAEVTTWVEMIRTDRPDWLALEFRFGPGEREAEITAGGGRIRVRGAIDRVDRVPGGGLRIVDYKTGSAKRYNERRPFSGGRRIQHVLYTLAAQHLLDEPVEGMEYHFPTRKGQMRRLRYGSEALERGAQVLETLFEIARSGTFVTTEEIGDCRFCGFAPVCRVQEKGFGGHSSERVKWAREIGKELPEYRRLVQLREIDD